MGITRGRVRVMDLEEYTESMDHCFLTRQGGISYLVVRWLETYKPTERSIEKPRTLRTPPLVSLVGASWAMRFWGKDTRASGLLPWFQVKQPTVK